MSERTYTEQEIATLLERASELQIRQKQNYDGKPGLTLSELESIARESGLDPSYIKQAAQELDQPGSQLQKSRTGSTATNVFVERWVPGKLTTPAWEEVVAELRHRFDSDLGKTMGQPDMGIGTTEETDKTVVWKHTSVSGIETRVMIHRRKNGMRLKLSKRVGWAGNMTESGTYGFAFGTLALILSTVFLKAPPAGAVAIGLAVMAVVFPSVLVIDRAWRKKKHRELKELSEHLSIMIQEHNAEATDEEDTVWIADAEKKTGKSSRYNQFDKKSNNKDDEPPRDPGRLRNQLRN